MRRARRRAARAATRHRRVRGRRRAPPACRYATTSAFPVLVRRARVGRRRDRARVDPASCRRFFIRDATFPCYHQAAPMWRARCAPSRMEVLVGVPSVNHGGEALVWPTYTRAIAVPPWIGPVGSASARELAPTSLGTETVRPAADRPRGAGGGAREPRASALRTGETSNPLLADAQPNGGPRSTGRHNWVWHQNRRDSSRAASRRGGRPADPPRKRRRGARPRAARHAGAPSRCSCS